MHADELLTTKMAAQLLGVSVSWLAKARTKNRGPAAVYLPPRMVRYRRSVLIAYIEAHSHASTTANTVAKSRRAPVMQPPLSR